MMEGEQKIAQCLNDQKVLGSNSKAGIKSFWIKAFAKWITLNVKKSCHVTFILLICFCLESKSGFNQPARPLTILAFLLLNYMLIIQMGNISILELVRIIHHFHSSILLLNQFKITFNTTNTIKNDEVGTKTRREKYDVKKKS